MNSGGKIAGLVALSLIAGAGIAGGVYVANTPTNISSRASSSFVTPTQVPGLRAAFPTLSVSPSPTPTLMATPTAGTVTEDAIIKAFGTSDAGLDQNGDGMINALDLQIYRAKQK